LTDGVEILPHELFDMRDPKSAPAGTCKGAETDSQAKFGKKIVAEHEEAKMGHYGAQADSGLLRMLRLCSGMLKLSSGCSPSAQVNAAVAHVRRLKRKPAKGKINLEAIGILEIFRFSGGLELHFLCRILLTASRICTE
jgi:hypothetical protein